MKKAESGRYRGAWDFGEWNEVIRDLADYDPDRIRQVLKWPIREGLLKLLDLIKQDALIEFRHQQLAYVMGGGKKPTLPEILQPRT